VYSLNIPVPTRAATVARDVAQELPTARRRNRGEHTLGVKRLASDPDTAYSRLEARTREVLIGQPAFEVRIDAIECFENAPVGTSPVVYLAVDSPELLGLHRRLLEVFGSVHDRIEGEEYTPHVTIARGGSQERAERVTGEIDAIEWTVTELEFWDGTHNQPISTVSLPA
jgi:2'-5' RNA ligase